MRVIGRRPVPLLFFLFIACLALYTVGLDYSPAPYFSDESLVSAEVIKLSSGWRDFGLLVRHSNRYQDFSFLPYVATSLLLTKFFGLSVYGFRLVSVVLALCTGFALVLLSHLFGLDWRFSLLSPIFYWLMPPVIVQSRIAWDPAIYPLVSVVAICSLEWAARRIGSGYGYSVEFLALWGLNAGFWLGLVAWSYPPGRLCAICLSLLYMRRYWLVFKRSSSGRAFIIFIGSFLSCLLLMAGALFVSMKATAGAMSRTSSELILGQDSFPQKVLLRFFANVTNLDYLLLEGDSNLRHSLPGMGALGVSGFVLVSCIILFLVSSLWPVRFWVRAMCRQKLGDDARSVFLILLLIVIFSSPSFLGNTVVHSLRSCSAFPFWALLSSMLAAVAFKRIHTHCGELFLGIIVLTLVISWIHLARYTLGGLSFIGKKQLQGPVPIHSAYPGLSRSAFTHEDYVSAQGLPDAELCARVASGLRRDKEVSYGQAVEDSRYLLVASERSLNCAGNLH